MCTAALVIYATGKQVDVSSIRELQTALACDPVIAEGYEDADDGGGGVKPDSVCCLCPVDFHATAERAGFALSERDEFGDFTLTQISA